MGIGKPERMKGKDHESGYLTCNTWGIWCDTQTDKSKLLQITFIIYNTGNDGSKCTKAQ